MGVFKNGVGRPSNETIRKRRIVYAVIVVMFIALISAGTLLLTNYSRLKGASANDEIIFDIGGRTGGFKLDNVSVANLTWKTLSQINGNRLYFASDGKTVARARMRFPSSIYNIKYQYGRTANQWVEFVVYNKKGGKISTSGQKKVTGGTNGSFTYDFTVSKEANRIDALVYKGNLLNSNKAGSLIKTYTIKLGLIPTIAFSSQNSLTASNGIFKATKNGDYSFTATINGNYSGDTLWARWFTYGSSTINKSTLSYKVNSCSTRSFNTESKKFTNLGLTLSSSLTKRGGMLAIYSSKNACDNDNDGMQKALNYQFVRLEMPLTNTWSNSYGTWTSIKFNITNIDKTIGTQGAGQCLKYVKRYGNYILTGQDTESSKIYNISGDTSASSPRDLYNKIVAQINKGLPVILKTQGTPQHYILVVGYKNPGSASLDKYNILNYLWAIDPYHKTRKAKGKGYIRADVASKNNSTPSYAYLKYRTWTKK